MVRWTLIAASFAAWWNPAAGRWVAAGWAVVFLLERAIAEIERRLMPRWEGFDDDDDE